MNIFYTFFGSLSVITRVIGWPDGAPCVHAVFDSMNPLEAVEHQGGLQLSYPPYNIEVQQKCYWINQPVELSLRGNTSTDRFRGFAIQPISYRGPNRGKRIGEFLRLDDNGSWQQQCFRFKNSVTHSHDEKKKRIKLWWKNALNDDDYVQFVATVVKAQKEFWVKSVKSVPIPPCRLEKNGIQDYKPEPITPPPPVNQFKLDTFVLFDATDHDLSENLLRVVPNDNDHTPKPQSIEDFARVMQISNRPTAKIASPLTSPEQELVIRPLIKQKGSSQQRPKFADLSPPLTQLQSTQSQINEPASTALALRPQPVISRPIQNKQSVLIAPQQFPTDPSIIRQPIKQFPPNLNRVPITFQRQSVRPILPRRPTNPAFNSRLPDACVDVDPYEICVRKRRFCKIIRAMQLRCRKTCQLC